MHYLSIFFLSLFPPYTSFNQIRPTIKKEAFKCTSQSPMSKVIVFNEHRTIDVGQDIPLSSEAL